MTAAKGAGAHRGSSEAEPTGRHFSRLAKIKKMGDVQCEGWRGRVATRGYPSVPSFARAAWQSLSKFYQVFPPPETPHLEIYLTEMPMCVSKI